MPLWDASQTQTTASSHCHVRTAEETLKGVQPEPLLPCTPWQVAATRSPESGRQQEEILQSICLYEQRNNAPTVYYLLAIQIPLPILICDDMLWWHGWETDLDGSLASIPAPASIRQHMTRRGQHSSVPMSCSKLSACQVKNKLRHVFLLHQHRTTGQLRMCQLGIVSLPARHRLRTESDWEAAISNSTQDYYNHHHRHQQQLCCFGHTPLCISALLWDPLTAKAGKRQGNIPRISLLPLASHPCNKSNPSPEQNAETLSGCHNDFIFISPVLECVHWLLTCICTCILHFA